MKRYNLRLGNYVRIYTVDRKWVEGYVYDPKKGYIYTTQQVYKHPSKWRRYHTGIHSIDHNYTESYRIRDLDLVEVIPDKSLIVYNYQLSENLYSYQSNSSEEIKGKYISICLGNDSKRVVCLTKVTDKYSCESSASILSYDFYINDSKDLKREMIKKTYDACIKYLSEGVSK